MKLRFPVFLILFLSVSSCKHPNQKLAEEAPFISENFKDDRGKNLSFSASPSRIVSLAPSTTELLFAIGAGNRVVGRSHACNYPGMVEDIPEIRTFPEMSHESVFALKPDFILGTLEIQKSDDMAPFEERGIPVMLQSYHKLSDIYRNIKLLGSILKLEKEAGMLADSLERVDRKISSETSNQVKYGTMVLLGFDPLVAVGGGGFINELITKAGGKNVFGTLSESYAQITEEAIVKAQPEFVILASMDDDFYSKLIAKFPDLHTKMPAALNHQVFLINPNTFVRPGPRIIEGLADLTQILHPRVNARFILDGGESIPADSIHEP